MLHSDSKPLVCSMSPVGRIFDTASGSENFVYVEPAIDCPGIHSKKINKLSYLKKKYQKELDFQRRFYSLLAHPLFCKKSEKELIKTLYSFHLRINFEKTLLHLEKMVST